MWILPKTLKPTENSEALRESFNVSCEKSMLFGGEPKSLEALSKKRSLNQTEFLFQHFAQNFPSHVFDEKKQALSLESEGPLVKKVFCQMELEDWDSAIESYKSENTKRYMPNSEGQRWCTPCARDYRDVSCRKPPLPHPKVKDRETRGLPRQLLHLGEYKGVANARWVESLMGLPKGWVLTYIKASKEDA